MRGGDWSTATISEPSSNARSGREVHPRVRIQFDEAKSMLAGLHERLPKYAGPFDLPEPDDDLNEMLQRQFYFFGTYFLEEDILSCWETAAKGAKVIFDVDANSGIYSLAALGIQLDAIVHP